MLAQNSLFFFYLNSDLMKMRIRRQRNTSVEGDGLPRRYILLLSQNPLRSTYVSNRRDTHARGAFVMLSVCDAFRHDGCK